MFLIIIPIIVLMFAVGLVYIVKILSFAFPAYGVMVPVVAAVTSIIFIISHVTRGGKG